MSGPVLSKYPLVCPGTYHMDFYCKYVNPDHPFQKGGNYSETPTGCATRGEAIATVRKLGWLYHRDGTATCPICADALKKG